jgi:hypothetical protein
MTQRILRLSQNDLHGGAIEIAVEDYGMNVAFAADGGSVAQPLGHALNRSHEILLRLRFRVEALKLAQCDRGEHRSRPRSKIFRGELRTGDFPQVVVHVLGLHVLLHALLVDVLK